MRCPIGNPSVCWALVPGGMCSVHHALLVWSEGSQCWPCHAVSSAQPPIWAEGQNPQCIALWLSLTGRLVLQVASGRFGVTPQFIMNAEQLEIKIAQGAKPGARFPCPAINPLLCMLGTSHRCLCHSNLMFWLPGKLHQALITECKNVTFACVWGPLNMWRPAVSDRQQDP